MSRRAAATVALAVAVASCGFPAQDQAEVIPADRIPDALRERDVADIGGVADSLIAVWFIRDGALERRLEPTQGAVTVAAALAALVIGPDPADAGPTVRTAVVADVVASVQRDGARASVDLSTQFRDVDPDDQLLAVGQMVMTLTDVAGVGEVAFTLEGTQIAVPLPEGETTDSPVTRRQYVALVRASES